MLSFKRLQPQHEKEDKMDFNETLKRFSAYKEAKTGSGNVTADEVKQIREHVQNESNKAKKANSYKEANTGKNFMKVVREFASFKEAETGSNHVTAEEIKQLREGLEARASKKMEETTAPVVESKEDTKSFEKIVEEFAAFKKANGSDEKVTIAERVELRKNFNAQIKAMKEAEKKTNAETPVEAPKTLKEAVEAASAKKFAETGDRKISREEFDAIKKAFNESKETPANETPATEKVEESKGSIDTVIASLKEAANCVKIGRHALKEGDMPMAQDMAAQAGAAVDAANAAMPAPVDGQPAADPVLAQKITDVKVAVDDLAMAAGVNAPTDLGADPAAGIPAVEGQPAAGDAALDPAAQTPVAPAAAPVQESVESEIQARINARKAELEESAKNPYEVKDITGEQGTDNTVVQGAGEETNPSQLAKVPTAKQLGAGTDKNVVRFGDKETTTAPKGVKESTLPEAAVDKYLEKLDFKKIFTVLEQND